MSSLRCSGLCYKCPSVGCLGNEMMHGRTRQAPPALGQSWAELGPIRWIYMLGGSYFGCPPEGWTNEISSSSSPSSSSSWLVLPLEFRVRNEYFTPRPLKTSIVPFKVALLQLSNKSANTGETKRFEAPIHKRLAYVRGWYTTSPLELLKNISLTDLCCFPETCKQTFTNR